MLEWGKHYNLVQSQNFLKKLPGGVFLAIFGVFSGGGYEILSMLQQLAGLLQKTPDKDQLRLKVEKGICNKNLFF